MPSDEPAHVATPTAWMAPVAAEPLMMAYDDGVIRLEALAETLVDELADPPVCTWCSVGVFQTWSRGRVLWAHLNTGLLVCSGQVIGGWEALHEATPLAWRVAK
jgi:hypothetical protein